MSEMTWLSDLERRVTDLETKRDDPRVDKLIELLDGWSFGIGGMNVKTFKDELRAIREGE